MFFPFIRLITALFFICFGLTAQLDARTGSYLTFTPRPEKKTAPQKNAPHAQEQSSPILETPPSGTLSTPENVQSIEETAVPEKTPVTTPKQHIQKNQEKTWCFMMYMAGNNNLYDFIADSVNQAAAIGSNNRLTITAYIDSFDQNTIEQALLKNKTTNVKISLPQTTETSTGSCESLYDFCAWTVKNYPADHYALSIWGHGSGMLDPHMWGRSNKLNRGIAFNDNYRQYLTNSDLSTTLGRLSQDVFGGEKIFLIFDACNMGDLEVMYQVAPYCNYIVSSEEFIWAPGLNYTLALEPFTKRSLSPFELAQHMVAAYKKHFNLITYEYTFAAVDATKLQPIVDHLSGLGSYLSTLLSGPDELATLGLLDRILADDRKTTWFFSNSYVDLHHFYLSLLGGFGTVKTPLSDQIRDHLNIGLSLIQDAVVASCSGAYIPHARGIAIYFPTSHVHSSYYETRFGQTATDWTSFLQSYTKLS